VSTTSTTSGDSGLSGGGIVLVVIGAVILIGGIAYFIWRDSRRHTRGRHAATAKSQPPRPSVPGSKRPTKARQLSAAEKKRRKRGRAR
jgi:hypothetical protein